VLFPSFLSPEEVDHMIAVSRDNLERSEVLVAEGDDTQSDIRTSFGFWPEADHVVSAISVSGWVDGWMGGWLGRDSSGLSGTEQGLPCCLTGCLTAQVAACRSASTA
jgi:hypothetical protein